MTSEIVPPPVNRASELPPSRVSVEQFARRIGLQPDAASRFTFTSEHVAGAYDFGQQFNREGSVLIDGIASPAVIASLIHGAHPAEALVPYQGKQIKILEPIPQDKGAGPLAWQVSKTDQYTLVEFQIPGGTFDLNSLETVIPPDVDPSKPVIISGRGPLALTQTIGAGYRHYKGVPAVGFYQPKSQNGPAKTEIGISHDQQFPLGLGFGEPSEIGLAKKKHVAQIVENLGRVSKGLGEYGVGAKVDGTNITISFPDGEVLTLDVREAKANRAHGDSPKEDEVPDTR